MAVVLRVLRSVEVACVVFVALRLCCVAVAFRCASGRCASFQAVLLRFGWLLTAAPGLSVLVPCSAEHKIEVFVSEWAIFPRFLVVLTQKWGFCAREA